MTDNLNTMNVWLAIIALVSLAEFAMLVAAGVMMLRLYRRVSTTLEEIQVRHIAPLAEKLNTVAAEVQDVTRRVQRADDAVRAAVGRIEDGASRVIAVAQRGWPVVAGWRAVSAAMSTLVGGRSKATAARSAVAAGTRRWRAV